MTSINKKIPLHLIIRNYCPAFRWVVLILLINLFSSCSQSSGIREDPYRDIKELIKSKIIIRVPDSVKVGNIYHVNVGVSSLENDSLLLFQKKIWDDSEHEPELDSHYVFHSIEDTIYITSRVRIDLIDPCGQNDPNFSISPIGPEEQIVDTFGVAIWKWAITPLTEGLHPLELVITVQKRDRYGIGYKNLKMYSRQIFIYSSRGYTIYRFFVRNWQWLTVTIFLPLFIWLVRWINSRQWRTKTIRSSNSKSNNKVDPK